MRSVGDALVISNSHFCHGFSGKTVRAATSVDDLIEERLRALRVRRAKEGPRIALFHD